MERELLLLPMGPIKWTCYSVDEMYLY